MCRRRCRLHQFFLLWGDVLTRMYLKICAGHHRGANVTLEDGPCIIGSGDRCDILLLDDGIAETHCTIEQTRRGCSLVARDGSVGIVGMGDLAPQFQTEIALPVTLDIGEARIRLSPPAPPAPPHKRRAAAMVSILLTLAAAILFLPQTAIQFSPQNALSTVFDFDPRLMLGRVSSAHQSEPVAPDVPKNTVPEQQASNERTATPLSEVEAALLDELSRRGLYSLKIAVGDAELRVSGTLPETSRETWASTRDWFDSSYGGVVLITEGLRFEAADAGHPPPPYLQSVWLVGTPYVIINDKRVYPGDVLDSGWQLERISEAYSEFSFGRHKARVRYLDTEQVAEG